ncbi:hypothetical protein M433DRAFT_135232 [Acidomyces richmondensis BFW]|nr:hypothetical protein M433DRAFT_135232 [Acidomyces richmondensis BFW]
MAAQKQGLVMEDGIQTGLESDSEWEYEYDQNDTEEYYFTLDLTALRATSLAGPQANSKRSGQRPASQCSRNLHGTLHDESTASQLASNLGESAGELQVLGLHSGNPFVWFNGEYYSCSWSSELGTQFFISQPGAVKRPLRKGQALDVIGISRIRLLGKPVKLQERIQPNVQNGSQHESWMAIAKTVDDDASHHDHAPPSTFSDGLQLRGGQSLQIPKERIKDAATQAQASFLERWSAIKLKKGETDSIPVNPVRHYQLPSNMGESRMQTESGRVRGPTTGEGDIHERAPKRQRIDAVISNVPEGPLSFRPLLPAPVPDCHTQSSTIPKKPLADFESTQLHLATTLDTVQYDISSWDQSKFPPNDMSVQPGVNIISYEDGHCAGRHARLEEQAEANVEGPPRRDAVANGDTDAISYEMERADERPNNSEDNL